MTEDDILPELSRAVEYVDNALSFQIGVIYRTSCLMYLLRRGLSINLTRALEICDANIDPRIIPSNTMHL